MHLNSFRLAQPFLSGVVTYQSTAVIFVHNSSPECRNNNVFSDMKHCNDDEPPCAGDVVAPGKMARFGENEPIRVLQTIQERYRAIHLSGGSYPVGNVPGMGRSVFAGVTLKF
jgi:hypothetical protein